MFFNILRYLTTHPLNKDHKFRSLVRFIKWQLGSRLVPGETVYSWIDGSKFYVKTGETSLVLNIYTGLYEFEDMGYLLHVLRPNDLFIDVGANVGSYTILASAVRGASCYSFEPIPETYNRLENNIRLNNIESKVKALNVGLGCKEGVIKFTHDLGAMNRAIVVGESYENAINVNITTLDDVLKNESPSLLKIDVEGFEAAVLEGASETLGKYSLHSVILELNGSGMKYNHNESRIHGIMSDYGFNPYSYDPLSRILLNYDSSKKRSDNTLFIRDDVAVLERLKSAPFVNVHGKHF